MISLKILFLPLPCALHGIDLNLTLPSLAPTEWPSAFCPLPSSLLTASATWLATLGKTESLLFWSSPASLCLFLGLNWVMYPFMDQFLWLGSSLIGCRHPEPATTCPGAERSPSSTTKGREGQSSNGDMGFYCHKVGEMDAGPHKQQPPQWENRERNQVCPSPHDYKITGPCFGLNFISSDSNPVHEVFPPLGPLFGGDEAMVPGWRGGGGRRENPCAFSPSCFS